MLLLLLLVVHSLMLLLRSTGRVCLSINIQVQLLHRGGILQGEPWLLLLLLTVLGCRIHCCCRTDCCCCCLEHCCCGTCSRMHAGGTAGSTAVAAETA